MFPFLRMIIQLITFRNKPKLGAFDTHVSYHRCMPWDLDAFGELNNGRTLTLYDLGRLPLGFRTGMWRALRENRWASTMAGATVRYRRRIRAFDKIEMHSRLIGWDARFMYIEQAMRVRGQVAGQIIYRAATTDANGIVPMARVVAAMAPGETSPPLPDWVQAWIASEDMRPWPPQIMES